MAEKKAKRERGRILTEAGWNRLDVALQAWEFLPGNKRTQERIALEAKMDGGTIAKILGRREKADLSKIEQLFRAFGLSLEEGDHCPYHSPLSWRLHTGVPRFQRWDSASNRTITNTSPSRPTGWACVLRGIDPSFLPFSLCLLLGMF